MKQRFRQVFRGFLIFSAVVFFLLLVGAYITIQPNVFAAVAGYLLSFVFVGSNFFVIRNIEEQENNKFYRRFFITLGLRFILVLVTLVVVLKTLKIHQIYFTVSFIISYILHSVIEIISINKILETDN